MKKFLMVMGAIFVFLIVAFSAVFGAFWVKGSRMDRESKVYVETIMPSLLAEFTTENFIKNVAPANRPSVDRASMDKFTAQVASEFGAYKSSGPLTGEATINFGAGGQMMISAVYTAKVQFEKRPAMMRVVLVSDGQAWSLARVDFNMNDEDKPAPDKPASAPAPEAPSKEGAQ